MEKERVDEQNHYKILLLGAGESGKSTIIKQLSLLYRKGGIMEDRRQFVRVLQNNAIVCMQALLRAAETFEYTSEAEHDFMSDSNNILAIEGTEDMQPPVAEAIKRLWKSVIIQKTYRRRNEFWLLETAAYYFDNCQNFCKDDFTPNDVDIIMARKRTTGVIVTEFVCDTIRFSVVDVGGQRSERRKWINCFDGVRAIFWVSNLAGYDKVLFEDKNVNRMWEDLDLFKDTLKTPTFKDTPVFIFFNKRDLFIESLAMNPLRTCFPHYTGKDEPEQASNYIAEQFRKVLPASKTIEHTVQLSAKKKDEVQKAFEDVKYRLMIIEKEKALQNSAAGSQDVGSQDVKKTTRPKQTARAR